MRSLYLLLFVLSCATRTTNLDFYFSTLEIPLNFCPQDSECISESWENVKTIRFHSKRENGKITFLDQKLKTITLF